MRCPPPMPDPRFQPIVKARPGARLPVAPEQLFTNENFVSPPARRNAPPAAREPKNPAERGQFMPHKT